MFHGSRSFLPTNSLFCGCDVCPPSYKALEKKLAQGGSKTRAASPDLGLLPEPELLQSPTNTQRS